MGIVHRQREIPAELRDITGPGDALPVAMTVDALGNVFAPDDNYVLQPTGGLVHIIDAAAVTPADRARQRQLLTELTKTRPQWLVGAEVHKRFEEWDGVARGTITAYDTDYPKAWTVTYEADGVSEEFDAQDVKKYAIERIDGESAPDGGQSLLEKYRNKQVDPPEWGDGTQDVIPIELGMSTVARSSAN